MLGKGWDMSGTNAELIQEARDWADAALPPEPWRFAHVSLRLADALEAAEAERDAALATIAEADAVEDFQRDQTFYMIVGKMRAILGRHAK